MKLRFTRKSKIVTSALVGVAFAAGGTAYAFFTGTGAGSGTVTSANPTVQPLQIRGDGRLESTTSFDAPLVPGGPALTPLGTIHNPNSFNVGVKPPVVTAFTVDATHKAAGCTEANYEILPPGPPALPYVEQPYVPANGDSSFASVSAIQMKETDVSQDACKGATLTLTFAIQ